MREGFSNVVATLGVPRLATLSGISKRTLYDIRNEANPKPTARKRIMEALASIFDRYGEAGNSSINAKLMKYLPSAPP